MMTAACVVYTSGFLGKGSAGPLFGASPPLLRLGPANGPLRCGEVYCMRVYLCLSVCICVCLFRVSFSFLDSWGSGGVSGHVADERCLLFNYLTVCGWNSSRGLW